MKLPKRFSFCTAVVAGDEEYSGEYFAGDSSPTKTPASLHSNLSLQTLPSVPSLSLLDFTATNTTVTLTHSLSSSFSLSNSITSLSLHNSNLYATSAHQINVYDSSTLTHLETFNSNGESNGSVKSVVFTGGKILTAHQDGKIKVWKVKIKEEVKKHKVVCSLPTVKDRLLRFPLPKNHVQVRRHKKRLWVEHHDAVSGLAVNHNVNLNGTVKKLVYSVSWDKTLKVWDPNSGFKCQESITAHDDAINAVTVFNSPANDVTVYTGSADGRINVWSREGESSRHVRVATLEKHKSAVNALALNNDGSILFSGACDRSILVWEREDSAKYMVVSGALRGHSGAILCLINVSDFLISGSADRTVRIWRRGFEGKFCCLAVLVGHLKPVKSLAAKMDGDDGITIFSGGLDGEIKVWKVKVNCKS